jgi:hypothetical protein
LLRAGKLYVTWLFVVMITYTWNSAVIPLRAVFPYQSRDNWKYWLMADYMCDVIYLLDIFVFKTRLRFTDNGIVEVSLLRTFLGGVLLFFLFFSFFLFLWRRRGWKV